MASDWTLTPLVAGLLLGGALSIAVGMAFVVGQRLFPDRRQETAARIGGEERRRTDVRAYLEGIGETYVEGHRVAGQSVAFYLPDRDVAITFDVRVYFRVRRTETVAILYEHEMPPHHLAARFPFDVPTWTPAETAESTPGASVRAAFAALDLPVGVDAERIEAAYRDRVKESHPDHGGDEAEFKRIREAYAIATEHADSADWRRE